MKPGQLLAKLVKIESFSGQEQKLAVFIMNFAKKHGLAPELKDGNVIIKFIGNSSKAIIFDAHMDTVKPGDLHLWKVPPFGKDSGIIEDKKLYGLGASDDKAAIAALLILAVALKKTVLTSDVFMVFVTNEEADGSGSQSFVKHFKEKYIGDYKEIAAVLGEPTNLTSCEIGHRGNIFIKVTTAGDAGHGSNPENIKTHAIFENIKIIEKIISIGNELADFYKDPILLSPSFCLTGIQSGQSSPSAVPSICSSTWDIRTTPKLHNKVIDVLKEKLGSQVKIEYLMAPSPFGYTSPNSKIVHLLQSHLHGLDVKISPGANDICFFTDAGIDAVAFGPGQKDVIHRENEFVELEKVFQSIQMCKKLIKEF
ncbi:M20/M25/M40 family metallo-hydrolase [Candidatus Gottesmanbacteria bacterium]|nr:M20/M25/M40 family metallo-hydrolase [Candidatus Gottesmanbacteria bacterium]